MKEKRGEAISAGRVGTEMGKRGRGKEGDGAEGAVSGVEERREAQGGRRRPAVGPHPAHTPFHQIYVLLPITFFSIGGCILIWHYGPWYGPYSCF